MKMALNLCDSETNLAHSLILHSTEQKIDESVYNYTGIWTTDVFYIHGYLIILLKDGQVVHESYIVFLLGLIFSFCVENTYVHLFSSDIKGDTFLCWKQTNMSVVSADADSELIKSNSEELILSIFPCSAILNSTTLWRKILYILQVIL